MTAVPPKSTPTPAPSTPRATPAIAKAYRSTNHEVQGYELLAVRDALTWLSPDKSPPSVHDLCVRLLGASQVAQLDATSPPQWYPAPLLLSMLRAIDEKVGPNGLRRVGRASFQRAVTAMGRDRYKTARALFDDLDALYRRTNRGTAIGGWKVLQSSDDEVRLEYTAPHVCIAQEGFLTEAAAALGVPVLVTQRECVRQGADACVFSVAHSLDRFSLEKW